MNQVDLPAPGQEFQPPQRQQAPAHLREHLIHVGQGQRGPEHLPVPLRDDHWHGVNRRLEPGLRETNRQQPTTVREVVRLQAEDKAWDFQTREAFVAFAQATFVEWTQRLPKSEWDSFIADVLDRYQSVAADSPQEANTFKFYQMEVELTPVPAAK